MMKTPKPRPYIRNVIKRSATGQKPRFTLVKIDNAGKRRRLTLSLVNADVLPLVEREFLKRGATKDTKPETAGGGEPLSATDDLLI